MCSSDLKIIVIIGLQRLIWNANLKTLDIELAGQPQLDEKYFIKIQDDLFWDIDPGYNFNKQYIDSLLHLETQFDSLLIVELQSVNDSLVITHEYIVLDTISKSIARLNDSGSWALANVNTLGATIMSASKHSAFKSFVFE